jgi:hypothetical protein
VGSRVSRLQRIVGVHHIPSIDGMTDWSGNVACLMINDLRSIDDVLRYIFKLVTTP